jgi:multifunctional 2-oxoglutarate metabolism enzyme
VFFGCWKRVARLLSIKSIDLDWKLESLGVGRVLETRVKVTLPEMGESVTEGTIIEWRVKPGQWVDAGETLVYVTTDKVDVEVPAPISGLVTEVFVPVDAVVAVGAPLAEINAAAQKPEGVSAPVISKAVPSLTVPSLNGVTTHLVPREERATYRAQRIAEKRGLSLTAVHGSGPNGLILSQDVLTALVTPDTRTRTPVPPSLPPLTPEAKITQLKGPSAALVGYMEQSLTIPTATSFRTVTVTVLDLRRAALNAGLKAAGRSEKISFTHIIAYALARGAREMPEVAASFRREGGVAVKVEVGVHLGLAVDMQRKDGIRFLVVPVIKNADTLDFKAFRERYEDLVGKARDGKLTADELSGATITLTNPGGIGTVASVPRLTAGQGAIIAAGAIGYPPGFARADTQLLKQIGIEKIMTLTSTYDHRVIQGAQSGEFLRRIDDLLAGADAFYEEIFSAYGLRVSALAEFKPAAGAAFVAAREVGAGAQQYPEEMLRAVAAGMAIVSAYRRHGHLAATLDPLGTQSPGDPALDPQTYGLTPSLMQAVPASVLGVKVLGNTLAEVLPRLRETYSSTIAYEIEHIANIEQRMWLRDYIEVGTHKIVLSSERARNVLWRLTKVETMERYLRKTYLSHKTFSIEGLDAMIPMLEEMLTQWVESGVKAAVIGMSHRGRLSTIAHVVNRPYEKILVEFESAGITLEGDNDMTGDVKYHLGQEGVYKTLDGKAIDVFLANNPSHLEAVDGVVEGRTRALQTVHDTPIATLDLTQAAPILIHGDAAFSAQGVVAEVLNLQSLHGYATGGTIHLIADNQIGFTTDPIDGRSTRYASDLAKGFDAPIVHVNADDVEACIAAVRLAVDFRACFARDIIIDLIGYRRFGHNEQDEPAYTQPMMYERIKVHPTVRELYAQKLLMQSTMTQAEIAELSAKATARITEAHASVKAAPAKGIVEERPRTAFSPAASVEITARQLSGWNAELIALPTGFTPNAKLAKQLERRKAAFEGDGELDWGLAEALAFASLLSEGVSIRLTGQDCERGTFSHRHMVLHDVTTGESYAPIQHLAEARASFEIYNSPLSEYACLAFEYGYAVEIPMALVLWEAQFGDFNNGAQIIIDQFIAAGQAKWGETSRLVMLLPHGYEGMGPEHSSARIERFLQLSAEGSMRVANCSTAVQYFHLLRLQAHRSDPKPLIIFTPKSLLRLRGHRFGGMATNLVTDSFRNIIEDARFMEKRFLVERLLLCSGKVYYDILGDAGYENLRKTAIARVEQLSPLPNEQLAQLFASYPNLRQIFWVQEEPKNMGAYAHVCRNVIDRLPVGMLDIGYIGRPYRSSPSEGYGAAHAAEQERIVKQALAE